MENILWNLFKKTGDVKYYLFVKNLESKCGKNDRKRGWDCNKRNKLQ